MLFQLFYRSRSAEPITDGLVLDILGASRRNNAVVEVTGLLLCRDRFFLQLLEGQETNVRTLFQKIEKDDRHRDVKVVLETAADRRIFSAWEMGYLHPRLTKTNVDRLWPMLDRHLTGDKSAQAKILAILEGFNSVSI